MKERHSPAAESSDAINTLAVTRHDSFMVGGTGRACAVGVQMAQASFDAGLPRQLVTGCKELFVVRRWNLSSSTNVPLQKRPTPQASAIAVDIGDST